MNAATVTVTPEGHIILVTPAGREELWQANAIKLAYALTTAVRASTDRNQRGTAAYHSTERIIERGESHLGRALHHLSRVFGLRETEERVEIQTRR